MSNESLADVARTAVKKACLVTRRVQADLDRVQAMTKDDRSPVTVADFAAQAIVAHELQQSLGNIRLVAEEGSEFLRQEAHQAHLASTLEAVRQPELWPDVTEETLLDAIDLGSYEPDGSPFWTLDPIDGTKGFLRGQQYAVALAWIEAGIPTVGVLGCPNLAIDPARPFDPPDDSGSIYVAQRDQGMFSVCGDGSGEPVLVRRGEADPNRVTFCESVERAHSDHSLSARIVERVASSPVPVRIDSQCKYAVVARGQADAYLRLPTRKDYVERIWDHAAGSLVASEAGCTVTDIRGAPLDFSHGKGLEKNKGVVVAAPDLHPRLLESIAVVLAQK